jgi:hypothetical protein
MNKLRRFPLALSILAIKTSVNRQLACKLVFAINTAERLNQSFNIITLSCRCSFNLTRYRLNKHHFCAEIVTDITYYPLAITKSSCVVCPFVRQSLSFHNVIYSMIYQISTNKFQMTQKIQLLSKMVSSTDITNFLK